MILLFSFNVIRSFSQLRLWTTEQLLLGSIKCCYFFLNFAMIMLYPESEVSYE